MTFYNHIENIRTMAINLTNGELWHGARDKARVFDSLDAARREYMRLSDENAKLRELVRDMHAVISDRNSWWDCMCKDTRRFADRMRELGMVE